MHVIYHTDVRPDCQGALHEASAVVHVDYTRLERGAKVRACTEVQRIAQQPDALSEKKTLQPPVIRQSNVASIQTLGPAAFALITPERGGCLYLPAATHDTELLI